MLDAIAAAGMAVFLMLIALMVIAATGGIER